MKPSLQDSNRRPSAFTLIELLIVVAIISILAALAVPNFLEAQTRAKISRAKSDMRTLATAIESYRVDHNVAPYRRNALARFTPPVPEVDTRLKHLSVLTTPIAYIKALPIDVFEKIIPYPNSTIEYFDPVQVSWLINSRRPPGDSRRIPTHLLDQSPYLIISNGPDGYMGPPTTFYGWPMDPGFGHFGSIYSMYDPTNGTLSVGNLYRDGTRGHDEMSKYLMDKFKR